MNQGKENPMYGKPAWNKNKPWSKTIKEKMSSSHKNSPKCKECLKKLHKESKGKHRSPATEIKKGQTGKKSLAWKGGKHKHASGYIWIYKPNHPFCGVRKNVFEHRLVVEFQIDRYLRPEETCHHLNKIKDDNRPENLMAFINKSAHTRFHYNPNNVKSSEIIFDGRKFHKIT